MKLLFIWATYVCNSCTHLLGICYSLERLPGHKLKHIKMFSSVCMYLVTMQVQKLIHLLWS